MDIHRGGAVCHAPRRRGRVLSHCVTASTGWDYTAVRGRELLGRLVVAFLTNHRLPSTEYGVDFFLSHRRSLSGRYRVSRPPGRGRWVLSTSLGRQPALTLYRTAATAAHHGLAVAMVHAHPSVQAADQPEACLPCIVVGGPLQRSSAHFFCLSSLFGRTRCAGAPASVDDSCGRRRRV